MPPGRVLVVDDDPKTLRLLRMQLETWGYSASTVPTAEKAWAMIARSRPGLLLTDVRLPGMSGLELVARIRADPATRRLPIIALSGNWAEEDQAKARAAGCDAFVAKPWDARKLERVVARLLARAQAPGRAAGRKGRQSRRRKP